MHNMGMGGMPMNNMGYGQPNPYGQQMPQQGMYGQGQQMGYGQPNPYAQQNPYGQPQGGYQQPYGQPQANPYQQNAYAQPQQANPYSQQMPQNNAAFAQPATASWTCDCCGNVNEGAFCTGCGNRRG